VRNTPLRPHFYNLQNTQIMKRSKKVYGVYNIVEWYANIRAGKASVRVLFSGGAMTTQGVTPATFATTDPIVQLAIEHSEPYRNGKIKLIKTYPTNEDVTVERNRHKDTVTVEERIDSSDSIANAVEKEISGDTAPADSPIEESIDHDVNKGIESTEPDHEDAIIVKVACDRDAAEYLRDNFGIALSKLRSKDAISAAAKQYGVSFDYNIESIDTEE